MSAVGIALGSALAPVISATIVSFANWRWLFLPSLLILLLLPLYRKYLEHEVKEAPRQFDWLGGSLLAASIALLLLGVTDQTLVVFGYRISVLNFLHPKNSYRRKTLYTTSLFRNKKYTIAITLAFLISGMGTSLYFLTPILSSKVYHLGSSSIGFAMVPAAVASSFSGEDRRKLADLKGNSYLFLRCFRFINYLLCLAIHLFRNLAAMDFILFDFR